MTKNAIVNENTHLLADDGATHDRFGHSVSLNADGTVAVIGAKRGSDNGVDNGSVYVFTRTEGTWTQQAKLLPSDGKDYDWFGHSVSVSADGTVALIGACGVADNGVNSGSAYVFTQNNGVWTQQAKLLPSDGAACGWFGWSVSASADGTVALIGAYGDVDNGTLSGSAYVFTQNNGAWTQQTKLLPSDGVKYDMFGHSVSLSADGIMALIGAYGDVDNGVNSGSAYVFTQNNGAWTQQAKLLANDGDACGWFGHSVSVSADGTVALIGACGDDDNGTYSGSAYIFTRSGKKWTQQAKLLASDEDESDRSGVSVFMNANGTVALIGAFCENGNGNFSGSAYVFTGSEGTWAQQAKLLASDVDEYDHFGYSVSVSADGAVAMIGSLYGDGVNPDTGSAYVFNIANML